MVGIYACRPWTEHLAELCAEKNINCELVFDAHIRWVDQIRKVLRKPTIEMNKDTTNTFCIFTGLPIAHFRAEYVNLPKPGILASDIMSWLSLIENPQLEKLCNVVERQRFEGFLKFTFI